MDDIKWVRDEHLLPMGGASEKNKRATEKEKTWKKRRVKDEKL